MSEYHENNFRVDMLPEFKRLIKESSVYWKNPADEKFIDAMSKKLLEYIGPYKDKLQNALRYCVNNQSSFPSIKDVQDAADALRKRPIDHIAAGTPDSRSFVPAAACSDCSGGLVRMFHLSRSENYGYCDCARGRQLQETGRGLVTWKELKLLGFRKRGEK